MIRFEACVESVAGVRAAVDAGADRIELCADLAVGGTTPSLGLVEWAVSVAGALAGPLAVHVLIRPRGGDFVYDPDEVDVMSRDIARATAAGADGIVLGALTPAGAVDVPLCARLIDLARPASVTFHRAFDVTADPASAFDDVLALGVDRLLTSGAAPTALDGAPLIASLVRRAAGRMAILPGGGITERTAGELVRRTGVSELHFSGRSGDPEASLGERLTRIMAAARAASGGG